MAKAMGTVRDSWAPTWSSRLGPMYRPNPPLTGPWYKNKNKNKNLYCPIESPQGAKSLQ